MFFHFHLFTYMAVFLDTRSVIKKLLSCCYKLMQLKISECLCILWRCLWVAFLSCFWCLFSVSADDVMCMSLLLSLFLVTGFSSAAEDTLALCTPCLPVLRVILHAFLCRSRVILCFLWLVKTCIGHSYKSFTTFVWLLSFPLTCLTWVALPGALAPISIALLVTEAHKLPYHVTI